MENLVCEKVKRIYSSKKVLDNINLTLEPNKIYGLLGRNGAGKTTLMSMMSAQNKCNSGNIMYGNQNIWENQNAIENICFLREISFSKTTNSYKIKAKEYLNMAATSYPNWDSEYAKRLVDEFELDTKKRFSKMSKGMLSALTIITALASRCNITMLDEPTSGLDIVMRQKFYKILIDEYSKTGRTFVISTHIIDEISSLFEEIILIDCGKIILKQNIQKLLESYCCIRGNEDTIDNISNSMNVIYSESVGREKMICFEINSYIDIEDIALNNNIDIIPVTLQNLFVYLTQNEYYKRKSDKLD